MIADTQTQKSCPTCGAEMEHQPIVERGNENTTTRYMGWWCSEHGGHIECDDCDGLHHPDAECAPQREARVKDREARIKAEWEQFAGMAEIPGIGLISIEECERDDDEHATYRKEDGCPDCGGSLAIFLERATASEGAEWQPYAECCTRYGDGCGYRSF
jgi:hypothetical protein